MLFVEQIISSFKTIDPLIVEATINKYLSLYKDKYPQIDFTSQENIDLIIMPVVAAELTIEVNKEKLLSTNTIDGVIKSALTDSEKYNSLSGYAKLLGFTPISKSWENLYNEIVEFTKNNWYNLKTPITNFILKKFTNIINLSIIDNNSREMVRNRVPYIQIPGLKINNFELSEDNYTNLVNYAFSIEDAEKYKASKDGGYFELPGCIDLYLSSEIILEKITVNVKDKHVLLNNGYYLSATHPELDVIHSNFNDKYSDGIIEESPELFIDTEDGEIEIDIRKYDIPKAEDIKIDELITTTDLLVKSFYPIYIDFKIHTIELLSDELKKDLSVKINEYFKINYRDPKHISIDGIISFLKNNNIDVTIDPNVKLEIYLYFNKSVKINGTFPLSYKDYIFNDNIILKQLSNNTVNLYLGEIDVIQE